MKSSRSGRSQRGEAAWGLDHGTLGGLGVRNKEDGREETRGSCQEGWREIRRVQCPNLKDTTRWLREARTKAGQTMRISLMTLTR